MFPFTVLLSQIPCRYFTAVVQRYPSEASSWQKQLRDRIRAHSLVMRATFSLPHVHPFFFRDYDETHLNNVIEIVVHMNSIGSSFVTSPIHGGMLPMGMWWAPCPFDPKTRYRKSTVNGA